MDKNYRIHTNIASDTVLNVNMQQDYDFLEVLTMKLRQKDAYKLHSSNYGVIIGRVLANDAFGIPNARISVFIERDTNDPIGIENIYPYSEVTSKDKEGRRYNLLPDYSDNDCYRIVGTFPNKRLLLDNDIEIEIYEKYWKYTTVTNNAGDYMIFGVPSGSQQIHVDIDLSDIGILSQKPRDFEYKGYNLTMFDNPNQFKASTNLDGLAQLFSQDKSVFVYPFWGDADNGIAAITRCDVQIQYKFEPTCVFMGSIVSDNEGNSIGHKCAPDVNNGMNDQLVAGEGTIEMIRKTQDGLVEEYQIQGNQLIDSDGVWCYQIPMNLDFIGTDEYGNIVPTDNPNKGIPTRTQVRFRISKHDTGDEGFSTHTAKYLVPMNPIFSERERIESSEGDIVERIDGKDVRFLDGVRPVIESQGQEIENMYNFGSNTPQSCFRDLYWNNVYSVKNYIPKTQVAYRAYAKNYSALKGSNLAGDKNPIPFNSLHVDLPFLYVIVCIIVDIISFIVQIINTVIICGINSIFQFFADNIGFDIDVEVLEFSWWPFGFLKDLYLTCVRLGNGLSESEIFAPGCTCSSGQEGIDTPNGEQIVSDKDRFKDLVVERLAEDFKIIKLDLEQDWINGCLYMPLWYWRKRKKKTFLFGLFTLRRAKNQFCDCKEHYSQLKTFVTCNVVYYGNSLDVVNHDEQVPEDKDWHRKKANRVYYLNGLIKGVENKDDLTSYYYVAVQATDKNQNPKLQMYERTDPFYAFRLYATDIILLGNLNEENLYGIPQLFKVLPATTANIPAVATIEEIGKDPNEEEEKRKEQEAQEKNKEYADSEIKTTEDSGTTVTTGMNWRHDGNAEDEPGYAKGLFMELGCTEVITKAKSCFNVERLSELGVNIDMTYKMAYTNGGAKEVKYGTLKPDGFISKLELDDMENRAMFATMNHIGFVPQEYQDSISGYTTQVEDENTSYLVPKFRYIYPVDFDGRAFIPMKTYENPQFGQYMFDETDQSYITFKLGADSIPENGEKNRMRHFYHHRYNNSNGRWEFEMPVYNNSFFFYFGINKGSTAIDKFNKMFYSVCVKNDKKPFTLEVESKGMAYCPSIYAEGQPTGGYIHFMSDDIQIPYAYELYNPFGDLISTSGDIMTKDIYISGDMITEPLESGVYVLVITDANGKSISEEVTLEASNISFDYETMPLGTKFYDTIITKKDFICNTEKDFYGILRVTKFYVDGYEFRFTSANIDSYDNTKYTIKGFGQPATDKGKEIFGENQSVQVVFELTISSSDTDLNVRECLCDREDGQWQSNLMPPLFTYDEDNHSFEFTVYRPLVYLMTMTLVCDGMMVDETTITESITIANGEEFDAKLNDMPIRFMIGSTSDDINASVANSSNFYNSNGQTNPTRQGITGWYGVHDEKVYQFNRYPTTNEYERIWSNYTNINVITSIEDRKNILMYKFDKMFSLSNTVYMTDTSKTDFIYKASGGVPHTLTRNIAPDYRNGKEALTSWRYTDKNNVSNTSRYPNIVTSNYCWNKDYKKKCTVSVSSGPNFNGLFNKVNGHDYYIGNYFAAFTNNGRYYKNSTNSGDCSTKIMQLPSYAPVNLERDKWKTINVDVRRASNVVYDSLLKQAFTSGTTDGECTVPKTQPYLRALYVDRKLDYDLVFWTPTSLRTMQLHSDVTKNIPIERSRISGLTYNGIEMSYDNDFDYNIISVNEDGTPNKHLEYSYSVSSVPNANAITIHNKAGAASIRTIWVGDTEPSDGNWQYLKRYYSAYLNDTDIRNYFWSSFNKDRLAQYINSISNRSIYLPTEYIYSHTADTIYNGDYDMNTYPTKRLVDVGNIEGSDSFNLSIRACSYDMQTAKKGDDIYCKAKGGDSLNLNIYPQQGIYFVTPINWDDDDNYKSFGHMRLWYNGNDTSPGKTNNYGKFEYLFEPDRNDNLLSRIYFRYSKPHVDNNFLICPRCPRLIKVLDNAGKFNDNVNSTYKTDGITYIKTASKELFYSNVTSKDNVMDRVNEANFLIFDGSNGKVDSANGDVAINEDHFYVGEDMLTLNSGMFSNNLTFYATIDYSENNSDKVKASAILTPMDYYDSRDSYHTRHILSFEFSDIIDSRPVRMKLESNTDRSTSTFVLVMERDNGKTEPLEKLSQVFIKDGNYTAFIRNSGYIFNETTPQVTEDGTKLTFTITGITSIAEHTDEVDWELDINLTTSSGLIYQLVTVIEWDTDGGYWKLRKY